MAWYTDMCGSYEYGLTIHVSFMVKCVLYEGFGFNGFVTMVQRFPMTWSQQDGHHQQCGPPEVGLSSAASAMYGMLCNGWGTGIVLQVPQDSVNLAEKG